MCKDARGCVRERGRQIERVRGRGRVFIRLKSCLLSDGRRTDIPKLFVLNNEQPRALRGLLILRSTLRKRTAKHNLGRNAPE